MPSDQDRFAKVVRDQAKPMNNVGTLDGDVLFISIPQGELRGKVLGCWCAPKMCHGDVLAELAERAEGGAP